MSVGWEVCEGEWVDSFKGLKRFVFKRRSEFWSILALLLYISRQDLIESNKYLGY
jgi:hypothetical protein